MRTTLSLDPDVAALLTAFRKKHGLGLKAAVNQGLRQGLQADLQSVSTKKRPFRTKAVDHGRALRPHVDNVAEVLDAFNEVKLL